MDEAVLKRWKINLFQTTGGDSPIQSFIDEQDENTRAKMALSIRLLMNQGPFLKPPYIKKLQNNLYELRISGKLPIRIFYTLHMEEYYLLHVSKKKTQKTPTKELKTALDRMRKII